MNNSRSQTAQVKVKNANTGRMEDVGGMMELGRARALAAALIARGHIASITY